jgi:hypothetical protein
MAHNFMKKFGDLLLANGYPFVPVMPGEKKPGLYQRGRWVDYPGWTKHGQRGTTEIELAAWKEWPDAGIGIVGGYIVGVDIDVVDDADLSERLQDLAFEILGPTPAIRIGLAPKRMLVYRTATPFKGIKAHPLEILCKGQQFVGYAIHPGTGEPYQWTNQSLTQITMEELPETYEASVRIFLEQGLDLLPEKLRPKRLPTSRSKTTSPTISRLPIAAGDLRGTHEAVSDALRFIVNTDLPYDDWVRIGLAIKGALGENGAGLFTQWSSSSAKNVPDATIKAWDSFQPTAIGAGSLYYYAQQSGWKPSPSLVLNPANQTTVGPHPAQGLIDQARTQYPSKVEPAPDPPPMMDFPDPGFNPMDLDGVLKDLVEYMISTSTRPQPILALGNALCALGTIMGRRYRTETNLRSNLYVVGIADSGSGKNHSREIINELFMEAKLGHFLGGNRIASGAGLLTAIHQQPMILFQQDEFGMFLHAAADRRRSPRHITDILDIMTEMFTAAGSMFLGTEYAGRDAKNPRKDINQPCLCIYGTTTPNHFWNALQSANVGDGSLARFIILQTENDYPEENQNRAVRKTPTALLEGVMSMATGGNTGDGNLAGIMPGAETGVEPLTVPTSPQAQALFRTLSLDVTERLRKARGTPYTAVLSRIGENATKIALVRAVSFNPEQPQIREVDALWAIQLVQHSVATVIQQVERHVADNQVEHNHKRLLEIIRKVGSDGINRSQLCRKSRFLTKRERDDILSVLVEAGDVHVWTQPSGTPKPITLYAVME